MIVCVLWSGLYPNLIKIEALYSCLVCNVVCVCVCVCVCVRAYNSGFLLGFFCEGGIVFKKKCGEGEETLL